MADNPWDDFSTPKSAAVNHVENAITAENLPENKAHFVRGLFGQESGSGANNATSNRGAVGPMQIQPGTFKRNADEGWNIKNPAHSTQAAVREAIRQYDAAQGDTAIAAAGYYGGDVGRRKAARGIPVKDPINPNNPNTMQYGEQVTSRVPEKVATEPWGDFATKAHEGMEHITSSVPSPLMRADLAAFKEGPEAVKRLEAAKKLTWPSKVLTSAGLEAMKLGTGFNDLAYNIGGFGANLAGADKIDSAMQKKITQNRLQDEARTKQYKEYESVAGIPGTAGKMLPYIVSSEMAGPVVSKVAGKVLGALTDIPIEAVTAGKGLVSRTVDAMARSPYTAPKNVGMAVKRVVTDPWAAKVARTARQVTLPDPFTAGLAKSVVGNTALGAIEGGLHPDRTMKEGAINSLLGTLSGVALKPILAAKPNFRVGNANEINLIQRGENLGKTFLPGMKYGDIGNQKFEHAMSQDAFIGNTIKRMNTQNKIIDNRTAAEVIGMDPYIRSPTGIPMADKKGKLLYNDKITFTPKVLNAHLDKLGKEYNTLEAGTVPIMDAAARRGLTNHVASLAADGTKEGKTIFKDASDYLKRINQSIPATIPRDPLTGRMLAPSLSGNSYKDVRSRIKEDISSSFAAGNNTRASALKPLLSQLDEAANKGVAVGRGTVDANRWKDLNERFALTKEVLNHGMTPTGEFDPSKFYTHISSGGQERMLTDVGTQRISPLIDAGKLSYMASHQHGSDLSGLGVKNILRKDQPSIVQKLLMNFPSVTGSIPALTKSAIWLYSHGYPIQKGALLMSGKGFGNPALYTRALNQSANYPSAAYPSIYNSVTDRLKLGKEKD
jgi:hypothetical protein